MTPPAPHRSLTGYGLTYLLIALIAGPELCIWAAEQGWIGSPLWRPLSVQYGAFWPGLLGNWQPNYAAQPWTMFLSYSVLHTGPLHLIGNAAVVLWMAPSVIARLGFMRFALLWLVCAIVGGGAFALLSNGASPMVGASGCVFGVVGAMVMLDYVHKGRINTALAITVGLALLNILTLIIENGALAWQPHMAGYLAGLALAAPRPKPRSKPRPRPVSDP